MKKLKTLFVSLLATILLSGCSLTLKTSAAKFYEKATNVKEHEYIVCTVKGSYGSESSTTTLKDVKLTYSSKLKVFSGEDLSKETILGTTYANLKASDLASEEEKDGYTFYCLIGFKVKYEDSKSTTVYRFNSYGLIESIKSESDSSSLNLTFKYSK